MIERANILNSVRDSSGNLLVGGKVYFYDDQSSVAKAVYSNVDLSTEITQPLVLDSSASGQAFLNGRYRLSFFDSQDRKVKDVFGVGVENTDLNLSEGVFTAGDGLSRSTITGALKVNADGGSVSVINSVLGLQADGLSTAKIANGAVTNVKLGAPNVVFSQSSGLQTFTGGSFTTPEAPVANLSCTITTTGRPVVVRLVAADAVNASFYQSGVVPSVSEGPPIFIKRGTVYLAYFYDTNTFTKGRVCNPPGMVSHKETSLPAGTYTYSVVVGEHFYGTTSLTVSHVKLMVREI